MINYEVVTIADIGLHSTHIGGGNNNSERRHEKKTRNLFWEQSTLVLSPERSLNNLTLKFSTADEILN